MCEDYDDNDMHHRCYEDEEYEEEKQKKKKKMMMMTTMTSMMRMMTRMLTMLLLLLMMMRRRKMRTMRMRMSHGATEAQLKCSFKPLARFKVRRVLQFHPLQSLQYCCTLPLAEHEVKI